MWWHRLRRLRQPPGLLGLLILVVIWWDRIVGAWSNIEFLRSRVQMIQSLWAFFLTDLGRLVLTIGAIGLIALALFRQPVRHLIVKSPGEAQAQLETWLRQQVYLVGSHPDPDLHFRLIAEDPLKRTIQIRQGKDENHIAIGAIDNVKGQRAQLFDRITSQPNTTVLEEIEMGLCQIGVSYQGVVHPLREIIVEKFFVFDDDFTEVDMIDGIHLIHRAMTLVDAALRRAFKQMENHQPESGKTDSPL